MKALVFADMHKAGLSHISTVFGFYTAIASSLNASLYIPKPCQLLASKHNDNKLVDCDHGWSLYLKLPDFVLENDAPIEDHITHSAASFSEHYNHVRLCAKFVWKMLIYTYDQHLDKFWQALKPRALPFAKSRLSIVRHLISHRPFIGVAIRRGDDTCDTPLCKISSSRKHRTCPTSPAYIACWWQDNSLSRDDTVMLATDERDPAYVDKLKAYNNFTWVDPLIRRFALNNYEVYVGVHAILQAASRVLVRHRTRCSVCNISTVVGGRSDMTTKKLR